MSGTGTLIVCPNLQAQLEDAFPVVKREPAPLTEALLSPLNTDNTLQRTVSPGNGKSRKVELVYTPRPLETDVMRTRSTSCSTDNVAGQESELYDVDDDPYEYSEKMPMAELRYNCEQNDMYLARMVSRMMDLLTRSIETANFSQLALLKGKFASDTPGTITSDFYQVKTQDSAGKFDYDMFQKIGSTLPYSGYIRGPIVVGGFAFKNYFDVAMAGCCSASGVNIADLFAQYNMAVLSSYRADVAFGATKAIAFEPQAVQMIKWNEYEGVRGINTIETETYKQTILVDPATGLPIDFKWYMDCNGIVTLTVRSYNKLVGIPTDLYKVGDRLRGVTFVNGFQINNA